jgi:thiol:disulfide interchange protein DsbD
MYKKLFEKLIITSVLLFSLNSYSVEFLKPEDAFQTSGKITENELSLRYAAKPGYYMYQESLQVQMRIDGNLVTIEPAEYPKAHEKFDENFQKIVRTYKDEVIIHYDLKNHSYDSPLQLEVQVQGCAEKGICYPPMTRYINLSQYDQWVDSQDTPGISEQTDGKNLTHWWKTRDDLNSINRVLNSTPIPILLVLFFVLGLGLAFTPCMLPMLPILSSVVFGTTKHHELSRKKTSILALAYVFGMAIAFSIAGMATAWFGAGVSAYLQTPTVTIAFGLLMIALAGSLLGWYELRLPHTWQSKVSDWMNQHEGGNVFGVFMLGALSSLIASPCITAPLAGVLTFIAQSGKVYLGGLILFVMAFGMGFPLMMFSVGARSIIPKAGAWMIRVQRMLAVLLIAYAMWMIYPVVARIFNPHHGQSIKKIAGIEFQVITKADELQNSLQLAKDNKEPVLVTYYADWCVSCKEIERSVLSSTQVQEQLKKYKRIEVDVTELGTDQKSLLKQYQIFGPPAFIFIDKNGQEKTQLRTVGLVSEEALLNKLSLE